MLLYPDRDSEAIRDRILHVLGQISVPQRAATQVNLTDRLDADLNVDSLGFIEFVMELEASFNIQVEDDFLLMESYPNVQSVIDYILKQAQSKSKELL